MRFIFFVYFITVSLIMRPQEINIWHAFPQESLLAQACMQENACPECKILERLILERPYSTEEAHQFLNAVYPEIFARVGDNNEWGPLDWPMIELRDYIHYVAQLCAAYKLLRANTLTAEEADSFYRDLRFLIEDLSLKIINEAPEADCTKAEELFFTIP